MFVYSVWGLRWSHGWLVCISVMGNSLLEVSRLCLENAKTAIFYASKVTDSEFSKTVNNNAAVFYMKNNNFSKAYYYASKVDQKFAKKIKYNEGIYYYKKDQIDSALNIFNSIGDDDMKKACYAKQYNQLQKKVSFVKTTKDAKRYKSTYKKMLSLAKKMGDSRLESSLKDTLNNI